MKILLHFILTLTTYAVLDLLWINVFAKSFIRKQVGSLLATQPDLTAGLFFYCIFTACLLYFCVYPALLEDSAGKALLNGALFGLVTYATYELVNRAMLQGWPYPLVVVDIAYGIVVGTAVSYAGYWIGRWLW